MCAQTAKQNITIKKYANRRLYNTATSSYVTLEDLSEMVKIGSEFNVYDAKTSEDITRSVLTQIIVEEENKEDQQNLLPISFLRQLIGFYGDNLQWMVPKYLEHSMGMLSGNQDQIRDYFQTSLGGMFPFGSTLEDMGKQNMSMFENALRMFSPMTGFDALTSTLATTKPSSTSSNTTTNTTASSYSTAAAASNTSSKSDNTTCCASTKNASKSKSTNNDCCSNTNSDSKSCKTADTAATTAPSQMASVTNLKPRATATTTTTADTTATTVTPTTTTTTAASTSTPMPNVQNVTAANAGAEDMQQKIANLQRQLADLAKSRA